MEKLKLTPEAQREFLLAKLEEFAEILYTQLREQARQKSEHVPEETLRLLSYNIIQNRPQESLTYALSLQDSGRIVDMRRLRFTRNPISRGNNFIAEWAQKKGKAFFRKGVPGYEKGSKVGIDEEAQIQRIAAAIIYAKGSQKNRKKRRRKRSWSYNKTVYGNLEKLRESLLKDQVDFFASRLAQDMEREIKIEL